MYSTVFSVLHFFSAYRTFQLLILSLMLLNCGAEEDSWVPWTARRTNQLILKEIILNIHWKDWCWSWSSNTVATWWEEPTYWKRPWCWKRLRAGGEADCRGWHGWMASLTHEREFEQTLRDSEGQGSLVYCSLWGCKESDVAERLNNNIITKGNLGMNVSNLSVLGQLFFHQLLRKSEQLVKRPTRAHFLTPLKFHKY